jgi:hypothetical protein
MPITGMLIILIGHIGFGFIGFTLPGISVF